MDLSTIFLKTKEFNKQSDMPLKEDPTFWESQILGQAKRQYPDIPIENCQVVFNKIDLDEGFAVGEIALNTQFQDEKKISTKIIGSIPLIIKNFTLEPLDLFIKNNNIFFLTPDRLRQFLFSPELMTGKTKKIVGISKDNITIPKPGDTILGNITNTISNEDKVTFAEDLRDSETFQKLSNILDKELISGILKNDKQSSDEIWESLQPNYKYNTYIYKNGSVYDSYTWDWKLEKMEKSSSSINEMKSIIKDIGKKEIYLKQSMEKNADINPFRSIINYFNPIKATGYFTLLTKGGQKVTAVVLPLYSFATRQFAKKYLAIDVTTYDHTIQSSMLGVRTRRAAPEDLRDSIPQLNDFGVFYFLNRKGSGCAFEPLKITNIMAVEDKEFRIIGYTMLGEKIEMLPTVGLTDIVKGSKKGEFYIPIDIKYTPVNKFLDIEEDRKQLEELEKLAETVRYGMSINKYSPLGPRSIVNIDNKYSVDWNYNEQGDDNRNRENININKTYSFDSDEELKGFLFGLNISEESIATIFAALDKRGYIDLINVARPDFHFITPQERDSVEAFILKIKQNLTKQAAELKSKDSVDAILSLNFINPKNIQRFISYVPKFEQVESELGEMLLTQRLGFENLSEGALEECLDGLTQTIDNLKAISS